ncbi:MAG: hypothetical protein HY716_04815 [Planctomycetes bacterium]|nr:hypothetical protein [Planctomycetota bacterium]
MITEAASSGTPKPEVAHAERATPSILREEASPTVPCGPETVPRTRWAIPLHLQFACLLD